MIFGSIAFAAIAALAGFFGIRNLMRSRSALASVEARYRPAMKASLVMSAIVTVWVTLAYAGAAVVVWSDALMSLDLAASPLALGFVLMLVSGPLTKRYQTDPEIEANVRKRMGRFLPPR